MIIEDLKLRDRRLEKERKRIDREATKVNKEAK